MAHVVTYIVHRIVRSNGLRRVATADGKVGAGGGHPGVPGHDATDTARAGAEEGREAIEVGEATMARIIKFYGLRYVGETKPA